MKKNVTLLLILCCLSFVVPLAYFIYSETGTIYGDDLGFYISHSKGNSFLSLFANPGTFGKFRPVSAFVNNVNIFVFDKNLHNYFLFNVGMQSMIIGAFAFTLNLFLRNALLSWVLALIVGLSRFSQYNISQIYNGGSVEGLGFFIFILTLYFIFKFLLDEDNGPECKSRYLLWALFFANVNLYVHERYITVLPFIALPALFYPLKCKLQRSRKMTIVTISALLVLCNYLIKTYAYHYNFFLGTGGDGNMTFDIDRMLGFFKDAVLSMIQYNTGEQGWVGFNYADASAFHQVIAFIAIVFMLLILILFFITAPKPIKAGEDVVETPKSRYIVVALFILMLFCLIPATSTIRLEQRWLQAPFAILFLILVYSFYNIRSKFEVTKRVLFAVFVLCFFVSDYYYYVGYRKYSYWNGAEATARIFKDACGNGMIRNKTQTIYILVDEKLHFPEAGFRWVLQDGAFFEYYLQSSKNIVIIDDSMFNDKDQLPYITALDKETEQVIKWDGSTVADFTDIVLEERARHLNEQVNQTKL